jgi:hypothetical protein
MKISARSVLMAGVTTLTVTAVAAAPSVQPAPPPRSEPTAAVQLTAQSTALTNRVALTAWLAAAQRQSPNSIGSSSLVDQQAAPTAALVAFPGLGNAIINTYNFIEPIVAYGVQWAQYLVGWIPFGWIISNQIGIFYFNLIEPIARTITYNIADWIGGSKSFLQALNDGIVGTANAGIGFLNAEIAWGWSLLPPLTFPPPQIPYLPWFGLLQTQTAGVAADGLAAPDVGVTNAASDLVDAIYIPVRNTIDYGVNVLQAALAPIPVVRIAGDQVSILWNSLAEPIANSVVFDLIDPVLNQPLNINSYLNGAYDVGATTVNSVIQTGINEVNYFLGVPFLSQTSAQARELDRTAEVGTVPSIVKTALDGGRNVGDSDTDGDAKAGGPLTEVRETVHNARNVIREATGRSAVETTKAGDDSKTVGNEVVRTQGDVRSAVTKAVNDVTSALGAGKPSKSTDGVTKTSTNVVKSIGDTARNIVKRVRETAKDARDAVKNRPTSDADE